MKKILSLAVAALLACAAHAEGYNRITLGYQSLDFHNSSISTVDGAKIGYTHGFGLCEKPLFLEVGADFNVNTTLSENTILTGALAGVKYDSRNTNCGITIPVSLGYKFSFNNKMWVEPYAGINLKVNIIGKTKNDWDDASGLQDASMNWFNTADMSRDDIAGGQYYNYMGGVACKRAQFGGQFGVNVGYKRVNLNVAYQLHTPIQKIDDFKVSTRALTVGVGYNF